jgi:hypothetical protein
MTLKELKDYVTSLPSRLDNFTIVNGEMIVVESEKSLALINHSVQTVYVDESTKEIQFLHQTEDDIRDLLTDKGDGTSEDI